MSYRVKLVQNDTPQIKVVVTDEMTGEPRNLAGATVRLKFKAINSQALQATLYGVVLAGIEQSDGGVDYSAPYNAPGYGGRVAFQFPGGALSCAPGDYEGEVESTLASGAIVTAYNTIKFRLRAEF